MEHHKKSSETAINIMIKMGYKDGIGLGKHESGALEPISLATQSDKRGFGRNYPSNCQIWKGKDNVHIEEELTWIESQTSHTFPSNHIYCKWIKMSPALTTLANETLFCDENALRNVLQTKEDVFSHFDAADLAKARLRANQFENIKSALFMNRAAVKMANIDAATNFMFTNIDRDPIHKKEEGPYYFADVCAGPGGFSEYILWRKKWNFKGFGFTLRGEHDFKLKLSKCASDATFRGYYGIAGDGNVCNPANIEDFAEKVLYETQQRGVHFMMADGGFSVAGNEGIQEILSKQIYICQCLVALEIVTKRGHFVTKLFDVFTAFSVGLIYFMYLCFEKVAIFKPNASRPANSERYLICKGLKDAPFVEEIKEYFRTIVKILWDNSNCRGSSEIEDILEIIPPDFIQQDAVFYEYIRSQNTKIAKDQAKSLRKLAAFCKNANLIDNKQLELKSKCLAYWRIPNVIRSQNENCTVEDLLTSAVSKPQVFYVQPQYIKNLQEFEKLDIHDWIYIPLNSSQTVNSCYIFVGLDESVAYRLQNRKWVKMKDLQLAKGTILYGEIVIEYCTPKLPQDSVEKVEVKCLHVIDALRLGNVSMADLNFNERVPLIRSYCKAVNFETAPVEGLMRVRPKQFDILATIHISPIIYYAFIEEEYYAMLPCLAANSFRESFFVNSILMLKTNGLHCFNTTYVLRAQLYFDKCYVKDKEEDEGQGIRYDVLLQYISDKLN